MKLRLMGLRCTHLVSTKKPDTRAFFGLPPLKGGCMAVEASPQPGKRKAEEVSGESTEQGEDGDDLLDSDAHSGTNVCSTIFNAVQHDDTHEAVSDIPSKDETTDKWWDCPICGRPQSADERRFNDHIDSCLSRQTIRDTVKRDTTASPPLPPETQMSKRIKSNGEKKRGRSSGLDDPRQKKLSFG